MDLSRKNQDNLSLSETSSGSCKRVAGEARRWEIQSRGLCLEGRIQGRENLRGNLPAGLYQQACAGAEFRRGRIDAQPVSWIVGPRSGGATVFVMEAADMR